jgi:hypothetical protein
VEDQWVLCRASEAVKVLPHANVCVHVLDAKPELVEDLPETQLVEEALFF